MVHVPVHRRVLLAVTDRSMLPTSGPYVIRGARAYNADWRKWLIRSLITIMLHGIHILYTKNSVGYQGTEDLNPQCFYSAVHGRLDPRPTGHEVHARMEQLMSQLTMTTISHQQDYRAGHWGAPTLHPVRRSGLVLYGRWLRLFFRNAHRLFKAREPSLIKGDLLSLSFNNGSTELLNSILIVSGIIRLSLPSLARSRLARLLTRRVVLCRLNLADV